MVREGNDPPSPNASTRGPRRFGASALALMLVVGIAAGVGGAYVLAPDRPHDDAHAAPAPAKLAAQKYQCPMHPAIVQDHPGDCPICGMKLVPMQSAAPSTAASAERKILYYRSPMNPKETSPVPRKDEMGMDYVPVYEDEVDGGGAPVPGLAAVSIDPKRQQLIGLRTAEVTQGPIGGSWRTVGRVAVDETRIRRINVKVSGFVEKVHVDFVGKPVRKGEPLFSIYSPELVSAQSEYLLARQTQKALSGAGALGSPGDELMASTLRRLRLWDVSDAEIARLERTQELRRTMTFNSPISGAVTAKSVVEGTRLNEGDMPYEITDLSTVWVLADIYENELKNIRVGMPATFTANAYPNRTFVGRVVFLDPVLDPLSRTAKVRLQLENPSGELKPELFGEVVLTSQARDALRIPTDAVVPTGTKSVVFVSLGEGRFEPREVQLGAGDGELVEVVSGLTAGEHVVTRANFLIDSESRLRATLGAMGDKQP